VKIILIVLGSLLLAGGVIVGVAMKVRSTLAPPAVQATVRVEPAARGDLVEIISAPGEVQPRTKVPISARVSAQIVEMPFKEGDRVKKGDLLVRLDARDLEAALDSAIARRAAQKAQEEVARQHILSSQAQIDSSQATFEDAKRDLDRQKGLLKTSDVSQSIVDTAQAKYDSLQAQLAASRFSLEADRANLIVMDEQLKAADSDVQKAKDDLSYTKITATIDGIVTRKKAEVGEMVVPGIQSSPGTTIMEIADLSHMLMVARIDESSIAQVTPGQKAHIRMQAFPDTIFDGTVETVATARADPSNDRAQISSSDNSRYFECLIRLDTRGQNVRSGLSADADIEVHRYFGIKVASQAVLGRPTETLPPAVRGRPQVDPAKAVTSVVYVLRDGKAAATPVTAGASDETQTLIKSGLQDGDPVIVGPYKVLETIADGQSVTAEKAQSKATAKPASAPTSAPATAPATVPASAPAGS
jgi:HlyD family secretion protein